MKNIAWDGYQVFLTVAQQGGLSPASAVLGLSSATIGRRMLEFEREIGVSLFNRSQSGYSLTEAGQQLFERLQQMDLVARNVEAWREEANGIPTVRIAAGTWVAWLISKNLPAICSSRDRFRVELLISEQRATLAHRESDIGVRAFEPVESNLAAVKVGEVAYAVYQAKHLTADEQDRWVAISKESAISAYLRWPYTHVPDKIAVLVNRPRSLQDLICAGAGKGVLPCFVGDQEPLLERVGGTLEELRHRQWLVMNDEDRHRADIRTVIDRLTVLMRHHARAFSAETSPVSSEAKPVTVR
ncbi:LysR family transcriptional regulator [Microvirga sp. VF16]|uniref:LysR family transcriptional regulator n=1 Tax=Microvirga sp. VF16 TaxID=2807101 RepID=UPI00193EA61C|nr:LysR family transcriptional regulator [Microvirga sp. VF16]QRM34822.1 LysR family transcriptional regulator [Microvirga sp. VF16]